MEQNTILSSLCLRDARNPDHRDYYSDRDSVPTPRDGCHCDSCHNGRDDLALEILRMQEANTPKTQEVATQDLLDALKGLYRLVEGTSGELYETMNPYSCWQMQKAGRLLNQAHGVSTKSAIFDGEG